MDNWSEPTKAATPAPWVRLPAEPGQASQMPATAPVAAPATLAIAEDVTAAMSKAASPRKAAPRPTYTLEMESSAMPTSSTPITTLSPEGPTSPSPPPPAPLAMDPSVSGDGSSMPSPLTIPQDVLAPAPASSVASPFRASRAAGVGRRIKLLLWGGYGSGKTLTALSFPRPLVLDLEGGAEIYEGSFAFDTLDPAAFGGAGANDWERVNAAVDYLLAHPGHGYETLVIDPVTVAWEACQDAWAAKFTRGRGEQAAGNKSGEFYEFQLSDWRPMKGAVKALFRKLKALDMHLVCTARAKPEYAEGQLMRRIGETFDGERNLPYAFDLVAHLSASPATPGRFRAVIGKMRNQILARAEYVYDGARGFAEILHAALRGDESAAAERICVKYEATLAEPMSYTPPATAGVASYSLEM